MTEAILNTMVKIGIILFCGLAIFLAYQRLWRNP